MKLLYVLFVLLFVALSSLGQSNSVSIVYNNIPSKEKLKSDWGYAAWIKMEGKVILFDTGTKPGLLEHNLKILGFDPMEIDAIVISHAHNDHTGGLVSILDQVAENTKVYLPNNFNPKLMDDYPEIGFEVNNEYTQILKGVWISGIFINKQSGIKEQSLVLEGEKGVIVITGCAHPGIEKMCENIVGQFSEKDFLLVTGGFHLMQKSSSESRQISNKIKQLGFNYVAPSHCTGDNSISVFKKEWGDNFIHLNLGDSYSF